MSCELCGRECKGCRPGIIDGVKMMLCPNCLKHGESVYEEPVVRSNINRVISKRSVQSSSKDVYKDMDKELVSNWNQIIKDARKKKGLTREDLGFKIEEKTATIAKIENGDLRPSDKMVAKLEKELDISLFEKVKDITTTKQSSSRMTLGDFIKRE